MRKFQSLLRGKRYFLGLMAFLILVLIAGLYLSRASLHSPVASSTTQMTVTVPPPTATPSSTATLLPTATPSPTVTPSPTAKPSPATLTVTPKTIYIANCTQSGRASKLCTFTLRNSSSTSTLAWTAKASNSHGVNATSELSSTSGTLPESGKTTVSLYLTGESGVCSLVGTTVYLQFTGPKNSVTVTVTC